MNNYLKLLLNNGVTYLQSNNVRSTTSSILFQKALTSVNRTSTSTFYSFQVTPRAVKNTQATRPKVSKDRSIALNYEQSQFAHKIGVTKSWNSWNTCM